MPRITTFGFSATTPPPNATIVLDCRPLSEMAVYSEEGDALLQRALEHVKQNPDAVVAFGCHMGQIRSVRLAKRLGRILGVQPEKYRK